MRPGLSYFAFGPLTNKRHSLKHLARSSWSGERRSQEQPRLAKPSISSLFGESRRDSHSGTHSGQNTPPVVSRQPSMSRRSPNNRPMSYIDLLTDVPYHQQIAPMPNKSHAALQNAVGSAASLLDTKKTLEMYRANVTKSTDPAVAYEFAVFMVRTAKKAEPDDGLDPAQLLNEAKSILQRLADRGYPFAQYYLGDGFYSGLFNKNKPDRDKALTLFVAASKHGHAESGYRAGLCYEFGWVSSTSYAKAVQFYRSAASKNHPGAATRLGLACIRGTLGLNRNTSTREGITWLKRATESADLQHNIAPYELGLLHLTGFGDDVFQDEEYGIKLITQAAELGHVQANLCLGEVYENGWHGCPRDVALSVHHYNYAATRANPDAMMALCAWYMVGAEPVLAKDETEAYMWAKQAADIGHAKAEFAVGYFTEMGIGCQRDPLNANQWYMRAANQGYENAQKRLAILHESTNQDSKSPAADGKSKAKTPKAGKIGTEAASVNGRKKFLGFLSKPWTPNEF
ncbi:HCP-like protein [Piedraia hortae CBS 480.64]|uniref:HCP-like protein n=1 Tax=Piedraia hortae CBS 480.64 TaxID=1314780 RepID=A0A6A7C7L9_9PEZI|nr:HCP-like protein [Piedraia hortae CBS 480.64]